SWRLPASLFIEIQEQVGSCGHHGGARRQSGLEIDVLEKDETFVGIEAAEREIVAARVRPFSEGDKHGARVVWDAFCEPQRWVNKKPTAGWPAVGLVVQKVCQKIMNPFHRERRRPRRAYAVASSECSAR